MFLVIKPLTCWITSLETGEYEDVVVEIERSTQKKRYLGGYRHKLSGIEFHHASAQTNAAKRPVSEVEKFNRDCQVGYKWSVDVHQTLYF